jgi:hypothetical protein
VPTVVGLALVWSMLFWSGRPGLFRRTNRAAAP